MKYTAAQIDEMLKLMVESAHAEDDDCLSCKIRITLAQSPIMVSIVAGALAKMLLDGDPVAMLDMVAIGFEIRDRLATKIDSDWLEELHKL